MSRILEQEEPLHRSDGMNRAEAFKAKALQYELASRVAVDPGVCRVYLDLARQLRLKAEEAEAFERAMRLRHGIWWPERSSRP